MKNLILAVLVLIGILPTTTVRADDKKPAAKKTVFNFKEDGLLRSQWDVEVPTPGSGLYLAPDNGLNLVNRTYVWSKTQFKSGLITLDGCMWVDKNQNAEDSLAYADYVTVVLHSTGKVAEKRSWENQDGIRIRLELGHGRVSIEEVNGGVTKHLVDPKHLPRAEGAVLINPNTPFDFAVKDDGKVITVILEGKEVLSAKYDAAKMPGHVWGIANREAVSVTHILSVASISVWPK